MKPAMACKTNTDRNTMCLAGLRTTQTFALVVIVVVVVVVVVAVGDQAQGGRIDRKTRARGYEGTTSVGTQARRMDEGLKMRGRGARQELRSRQSST